MAFVTRFAPSPTGPLHLGHAYSAILAHDMACAAALAAGAVGCNLEDSFPAVYAEAPAPPGAGSCCAWRIPTLSAAGPNGTR